MPKYDKLRNMAGNGTINWSNAVVTCAVVSNYTFSATHQALSDVVSAGGQVLATARLTSKSVATDGSAQSIAPLLRLVPVGGPYDLILFADSVPLVQYHNAITLLATSDVTVRPNGVTSGVGTWFRF